MKTRIKINQAELEELLLLPGINLMMTVPGHFWGRVASEVSRISAK